jgi:hypothetical protein
VPKHLVKSIVPLISKAGSELIGLGSLRNAPAPHFRFRCFAVGVTLYHLTVLKVSTMLVGLSELYAVRNHLRISDFDQNQPRIIPTSVASRIITNKPFCFV